MAMKILLQRFLFVAIIISSIATQGALSTSSKSTSESLTPTIPTVDCATVLCALVECKPGETSMIPKGQCCPICVPVDTGPDCAAVSCLLPVCEEDEQLVVPEGECCPQCQPIGGPDCSAVLCLLPDCEEGEEAVVPEGECCPQCQPIVCEIEGATPSDCASLCPATCDNSGPLVCPTVCVKGCVCPSGEVIDTVNKKCVPRNECPPIEDPCALVDCMSNAVCKVDPGTGTAFCEPSCDLDNGGCNDDQLCKLNQVQCFTTPCPPEIVCVDFDVVCAQTPDTGPCEALFRKFFYNSTTDKCELFIYGGCEGNDNRFNTRSECISACGADDPCLGVSCDRGSSCKVDDQTGVAFCEPSCELDNGGCLDNQTCQLQTVQCVTAPCPPVVNCVDINPCATVRCANGYRCEVFEPTGEAFCNPDCDLNNGGCPEDQDCQLQKVVCVRAPCPPVIQCVERSNGTQTECPPTCSKDFCSKKSNRRAMCSNPGPREIPGCTGLCQLTYCHTCYYSDDVQPRPQQCSGCDNLQDYQTNSKCFRSWANCVKRAQWMLRNRGENDDDNAIRCHNPPCPLRG